MLEYVILVDDSDRPVGQEEKHRAHRHGKLHRAFSVILFNDDGHVLLQQRAASKYHSGGLWSNTCCGHPRPGETIEGAAVRRLHEEMGIRARLLPVDRIRYEVSLDSGMIEHEIDHILIGRHEGAVEPNPDEVGDWQWVDPAELSLRMEQTPERFTYWFRQIWPRVVAADHAFAFSDTLL